jgi:hypothetical protein
MAGALSRIKKVGQAAEKAAAKTKGLGERAAEAALKKEPTARDRAIIEASKASKQGFEEQSKEPGVMYHATHADFKEFRPSFRGAHFLTKDPEFANEFLGIYDQGYELKPGANIMPVRAQVKNPFDFENPEHIEMVMQRAKFSTDINRQNVRDNLEVGNWNFIEDREVQRAIRDLGFDAFYVNEYGTKNLGVYDPKRIKSAIGMQGSYDITDPDITKAAGGAIDENLKAWHAAGGGAVTPNVVGGGTGIPMAKGGIAKAAKAASKAALRAEAKAMGFPTSGSEEEIQALLNVAKADPRTWTEEQYRIIRPHLAIHQDLRPGSAERVESIMSEGLSRGMVDYVEPMDTGLWSWARGLKGGDAYLFPRESLKFKGKDNPYLAPGNIPMMRITPEEGQSLYEAIVNTAVKREPKKAAGGVVDQKLKDWHAAQGGFTDSYEEGMEGAQKRSSDIQAYKEGKVGADALLKHFPGLNAAMVAAQLTPQMAKGGEVKMQGGGDPQVQAQLSAGVPVFMDPGRQGDVARKIIEAEDEARRKQEEERKARVAALPLKDKALGAYEAGRTIQSVLGQEMLKPIVALIGGEGRVKELEEKTVLPETEAGAQYLTNVADFLGPVGKAFETAKIPEVPFLPELTPVQFVPGLGRQAGRALEKTAQAVDKAIPESLKNLPVGASIELVGEGKKKAPADRTGLYSPMEKAALNLERKEGTGMAFLNDLKKAGVTDEELEFSNVKRNLMDNADRKISRNTVAAWAHQTRQPFNIHNIKEGHSIDDFNFSAREVIDDDNVINARAAELKLDFDDIYPGTRESLSKTLLEDSYKGENLNDPLIKRRFEEDLDEMIKGFVREEANTEYYENPYWRVTNSFGYEITGNEDVGFQIFRPDGTLVSRRNTQNLEQAESAARSDAISQGVISPTGTMYSKYQLGNGTNYQEFIIDAPQNSRNKYESPHWDSEDYEDVLLHTRTQDRTTTEGKPMLYVDEMQSDWHQEGRDKGYRTKEIQAKMDELDKLRRQKNDEAAEIADQAYKLRGSKVPEVEQQLLAKYPVWPADKSLAIELNKALDNLPELKEAQAKIAQLKAEATALSDEKAKYFSRVPDAPFKDKWHEIGVKQMLHYAAKNGYDRVGFSSANPHIERWGTDQFAWERVPKLKYTEEDFTKFVKDQLPAVSDDTIKQSWRDQSDEVVQAFKRETEKPAGWRIASTEQRGGRAGDVDLEGEARARGILKYMQGERINTKEELSFVIDSTVRNASPAKVERLTNKIWKMMQTQEAGVYEPRAEGMKFFYDEAMPKFLEKYAKKIGANFYETETKVGRQVTANGPVDKTHKVYVIEFTPDAKRSAELGQPYKKGGLVKVDQDLREWGRKMAGGGISKVAKAAGKAGKRMSKAEGEALGLYHDISSTKLPKPLSEVQKKVVPNPKSQMQEKKFVSPEKLQGGIGVQLLGDRAAAGQILEELEGVPMGIELQGGPGFIQEHGGWASHKVPLGKLEKKIRREQESGDPVFGIYSAMGPQGVDFNTFVSEAILKSLDLGALRKKDIEKFNNEMRKDIPKFVGIESPELYISLMTGPGAQRTKFVETVAKDDYQKVGFPNAAFARYGITEQELLDVPIGESGRTIARFGPDMVMEQKSGHKTYPYDLTGEYFGGLETPLPMEIMFPTFFEARRLLSKPESGDYRAMQMSTPVQYFDQHWLDNAMKYLEMQKKLTGRKKGGLAHARK